MLRFFVREAFAGVTAHDERSTRDAYFVFEIGGAGSCGQDTIRCTSDVSLPKAVGVTGTLLEFPYLLAAFRCDFLVAWTALAAVAFVPIQPLALVSAKSALLACVFAIRCFLLSRRADALIETLAGKAPLEVGTALLARLATVSTIDQPCVSRGVTFAVGDRCALTPLTCVEAGLGAIVAIRLAVAADSGVDGVV
jgi:hypothetical protein